jgi:hypothetical protein
MRYAVIASAMALALVSVAHAQTKPPSASAPSAADEAKFKAADKNANGSLEGTETDAFKANMARIDTNKDGKVTREEFLAASRSGLIR